VSNLREKDLSWSASFGCAAASVEWLEGPSGRVMRRRRDEELEAMLERIRKTRGKKQPC